MTVEGQFLSKSLPGIACTSFRYWVFGIGFHLQPRNFVFSADSFSCFYLRPLKLEMLKRVIKIRQILSVANERTFCKGGGDFFFKVKPSIVRSNQASSGKGEWLEGIVKLGTDPGQG